MKIEERDKRIFSALHKYRFLYTRHIHDIVFTDRYISIVRRRLRKLQDEGYIGAKQVFNKNGSLHSHVYYLKPPGYTVLGMEYKRRSFPQKTMQHAMEIISVQIQFEKAYKNKPFEYFIRNYQTERETVRLENGKAVKAIYDKFYSGKLQSFVAVTPDIKFVLERKVGEENKRTVIFIEVDRGTENMAQIRKKIKSYYEYHVNSAKRFMKKFNVNDNRFVVLFITTTQKRITNINKALEMEHGLSLFVFTTFEEFYKTTDLTEDIWRRKNGELVPFLRNQ